MIQREVLIKKTKIIDQKSEIQPPLKIVKILSNTHSAVAVEIIGPLWWGF